MFGKKSSDLLLKQSGRSFVAETMQIEGDFHYSGAVDVAGLINGNVYGKEMIIFDTGSVKGNLHVNKLNINGHVEGQIIADEISLGSNSIKAASLANCCGANALGNCSIICPVFANNGANKLSQSVSSRCTLVS